VGGREKDLRVVYESDERMNRLLLSPEDLYRLLNPKLDSYEDKDDESPSSATTSPPGSQTFSPDFKGTRCKTIKNRGPALKCPNG
jgi:hypothetical protein